MKILPINNINKQNIQFKAKFPKHDVQAFINEIKIENSVDAAPKLYTMLDIIKNFPGQKAKIMHLGSWHQILIDGKSVSGKKRYFCAVHALEDAIINLKSTLIEDSSFKRLSEEDFEREYYKNSKKTINDIENIYNE